MAFEKRRALSVPYDLPLGEHPALAREMAALGYRDAWSYEVDGSDVFTPLVLVATATEMRVGTAIANVYTRGPATLAMQAAALHEVAPGRFVLGIGSGSQPIVEAWNDTRFKRPATRVREMVQFLRQALAGERVVFDGTTFKVYGFRLSRPVGAPPPIHVGALREGMLRVAGEVADGVCINWLSAEDVKRSVAVVRDAARAAGRNPEAIEVTARLMVSIDPPGLAEGDLVRRRQIAAYFNVPVYKEFHSWLGRGEALAGMWQAWDAGERREAVAAIPERVIDEVIIHGTPEERWEHVERYLEAGVDTAFLSFMTAEREPAARAARIRQALVELAPRRR